MIATRPSRTIAVSRANCATSPEAVMRERTNNRANNAPPMITSIPKLIRTVSASPSSSMGA